MSDINDIKIALSDIGISQTKLASILHTNLTTVNNWFSRGSIPRKHRQKITQLLATTHTRQDRSQITEPKGFKDSLNLSAYKHNDQKSLIDGSNSPDMPMREPSIDYSSTKAHKSHNSDTYTKASQESQKIQIDSQNRITKENRAATDTGISHINLQNINDSTADSFAFDISLIPNKSEQNIKWDKIGDNIHIIDTNVDKYTGDGLYYLQYPHKYIFVDIVYLPFEQCYSIKGLKEFNNIQLLKDIHHTIKGKVIYKITKL